MHPLTSPDAAAPALNRPLPPRVRRRGRTGTDGDDVPSQPLAVRRRRVSLIRRRVIAIALAVFVSLWIAIFAQLVSGHDPALSRHKSTALTSTATSSGSSSSSGSSGGSVSSVTTSQS